MIRVRVFARKVWEALPFLLFVGVFAFASAHSAVEKGAVESVFIGLFMVLFVVAFICSLFQDIISRVDIAFAMWQTLVTYIVLEKFFELALTFPKWMHETPAQRNIVFDIILAILVLTSTVILIAEYYSEKVGKNG